MAPVFVIPASIRELEATVDNGERLFAQDVTDVENLPAYEVDELMKGIVKVYKSSLVHRYLSAS